MADPTGPFKYVAVNAAGRRVTGLIVAATDSAAFERLRRDGLSPLTLRRAGQSQAERPAKKTNLSDRTLAELLSDLSVLLQAGSDIRTALAIIGAKAGQPKLQVVCRALATSISGGEAIHRAFAETLVEKQLFVSALVAAGEAAGDLAGGLERAAEMLQTRLQLADQMVSVLSYPIFILFSAIVALGVILLFVVPSLEPLTETPGATPGLAMRILIDASEFLRGNSTAFIAAFLSGVAAFLIGHKLGLVSTVVEPVLLDGPTRRTVGGLVYGSFAIALGNMLFAGAPMSDALRLSIAAVRSRTGRRRLEPVAAAVRQGVSMSDALKGVRGFPTTILRLAAIGEASGALGQMMARAGKIEEQAAVRRLEAGGKIAGPLLIVLLGGLIGLLMAGLLSGVTQLGQSVAE